MKYLLDTHILLWALTDSPELSEKTKEIINDSRNDIFFSDISLWEIEIKHLRHPKEMIISAEDISTFCSISDFSKIELKTEHIYQLKTLSRKENTPPHKDPFDKLLLCQAKSEGFIFITHDHLIKDYNENCIMVV